MIKLWDIDPLAEFKSGWFNHENFGKEIGDRRYIPTVSSAMELVCSLDVLFLRQGAPGKLIEQNSDIDNRLKTLFDALRVPSGQEVQNIRYSRVPAGHPVCCLLEDDRLITGVSVNTDRLLVNAAPRESIVLIR